MGDKAAEAKLGKRWKESRERVGPALRVPVRRWMMATPNAGLVQTPF